MKLMVRDSVNTVQGRGLSRSYYCAAGLTYTAIGALSFLDRISSNPRKQNISTRDWSISFNDNIRWLVARQTTDIFEDEEDEDSQKLVEKKPADPPLYPVLPAFQGIEPAGRPSSRSSESRRVLNIRPKDVQIAGFNGRPNKIADTCYCFWVTGSLAVRMAFALTI